jgi:ribosomal protein S18 acetylase RimI-like enzyme
MWKFIYKRAFDDDLKISLKNMKKRFKMLNIKIEYEIIEDKTVGFCLLYQIMRNIWHIDYIAIDPLYQNNGYGRLLLNKMIKKYKYLTLECESNLIKYYNKFNFGLILKDYNYHGKKLFLMSNYNINNKEVNDIIIKLNNYNIYLLYTLNILLLMINNIIKFYDLLKKYNVIDKNINYNYYNHVFF